VSRASHVMEYDDEVSTLKNQENRFAKLYSVGREGDEGDESSAVLYFNCRCNFLLHSSFLFLALFSS
jgi:hypothetical protein